SGESRDDDQLITGNFEVDVLEVVLPSTTDDDPITRHILPIVARSDEGRKSKGVFLRQRARSPGQLLAHGADRRHTNVENQIAEVAAGDLGARYLAAHPRVDVIGELRVAPVRHLVEVRQPERAHAVQTPEEHEARPGRTAGDRAPRVDVLSVEPERVVV